MAKRMDHEFRYVLRRSNKLSDEEHRFLSFISTYQHGCLLSYDDICACTGWSRSKLKRVLVSLETKKLIEKTHRKYKKTTIKIADAITQKAFSDGSPMSQESWLTGEPMMAHRWTHDGSPMGHPILEKELERKLKSDFKNEEDENSHLVPKELGDAWGLVLKLKNKTKIEP